MKKEKTSLLRNGAVQTLLASLLCILIGLLVGYVARQHPGEDGPPADVQPLDPLRL